MGEVLVFDLDFGTQVSSKVQDLIFKNKQPFTLLNIYTKAWKFTQQAELKSLLQGATE